MTTSTSDCVDLSNATENLPISIQHNLMSRLPPTFKYCKVNIPGKGADINKFEDEYDGCDCSATAKCMQTEECVCLSRCDVTYDDSGRLLSDNSGLFMTPIYECNQHCQCSTNCHNRVVQNGIRTHLEVFMTDNCGIGVQTLDDVLKGTFICEYAGEIISKTEAKHRAKRQTKDDMNYIIVVNEYYGDLLITTCVDPECIGNVGRFINHSCEPNSYMVPIRVNNEIPKLCFFVKTDLKAGTELSYDYGGVSGSGCNSVSWTGSGSGRVSVSGSVCGIVSGVCGNNATGKNATSNNATNIDKLGKNAGSFSHVAGISEGDISEGNITEGNFSDGNFSEGNISGGASVGIGGDGMGSIVDSEVKQLKRKPCKCGTDTCTGVLPFDASLYD